MPALLERRMTKKQQSKAKDQCAADDIRLAIGPLKRAARTMGDAWMNDRVLPLLRDIERLDPRTDENSEPEG